MGTPQFAVPSLERILEAGFKVQAVFTQPDRPKGRGGQLAMSPVKQAAVARGLPVFQPERVRRPEVVEQLQAFGADVMVVVGYGQIIPQAIIDIPRLGIINVHGSLLPRYRGAAPIQWAVANGETETGVTTMRIDAGLDTGDMLLKWSTAIGAEENALELGARMAEAGAGLLVETLAGIERGTVKAEPQDPAQATLAPILKKEDGVIDWSWTASEIFNRSRGLLPWPGTYTTFRGKLFQVWKTRPAGDRGPGVPGRMFAERRQLFVECGGGGVLELLEVQVEGRKRIPAGAFLAGHRLAETEVLGVSTN